LEVVRISGENKEEDVDTLVKKCGNMLEIDAA